LRFGDFTENGILIHHDTKTGAREVPLFKEIQEIINRIKNSLGEQHSSTALVFGTYKGIDGFRVRINTAIRASGVTKWEKLFLNLRSSCITDMVERGYSEKTLDAMFGNSTAVRSRYYIQFRKEKEYARVLKDDVRLLELVRSGADENDLFSIPIGELLALRDSLVRRFGTGKTAS